MPPPSRMVAALPSRTPQQAAARKFSAAGASAFLPFLPMLPSQIPLNNLIYDATQIAIPTDRVDPDQLALPAHWELREIRRFMLTFGPLSSLFDFVIFAILLQVLHAGPAEFRTGWSIEFPRHPDPRRVRHPHPRQPVLARPP
jgi:hypothetical protein